MYLPPPARNLPARLRCPVPLKKMHAVIYTWFGSGSSGSFAAPGCLDQAIIHEAERRWQRHPRPRASCRLHGLFLSSGLAAQCVLLRFHHSPKPDLQNHLTSKRFRPFISTRACSLPLAPEIQTRNHILAHFVFVGKQYLQTTISITVHINFLQISKILTSRVL